MKLLMAIVAVLVTNASVQAADFAAVLAKDEENQSVIITLDSTGTPRVSGDSESSPTIKNFRYANEYSDACYVGSLAKAKEIFAALVSAADGDGDSYVELKSIKVDSKKQIEVIAFVVDERGEREEEYVFPLCK